jgi:hypothetical protein
MRGLPRILLPRHFQAHEQDWSRGLEVHSGFKVGYADGLTGGAYHHLKAEDNAPNVSWSS